MRIKGEVEEDEAMEEKEQLMLMTPTPPYLNQWFKCTNEGESCERDSGNRNHNWKNRPVYCVLGVRTLIDTCPILVNICRKSCMTLNLSLSLMQLIVERTIRDCGKIKKSPSTISGMHNGCACVSYTQCLLKYVVAIYIDGGLKTTIH